MRRIKLRNRCSAIRTADDETPVDPIRTERDDPDQKQVAWGSRLETAARKERLSDCKRSESPDLVDRGSLIASRQLPFLLLRLRVRSAFTYFLMTLR
jgi:hypothetical protein